MKTWIKSKRKLCKQQVKCSLGKQQPASHPAYRLFPQLLIDLHRQLDMTPSVHKVWYLRRSRFTHLLHFHVGSFQIPEIFEPLSFMLFGALEWCRGAADSFCFISSRCYLPSIFAWEKLGSCSSFGATSWGICALGWIWVTHLPQILISLQHSAREWIDLSVDK
jgi:hypothetical protein